MKDAKLTHQELSAVRGVLGCMQWVAGQTVPLICAELGLLQSRVSEPTVQLMLDCNKLLSKLKNEPFVELRYNKLKTPNSIVTWSDAAWANRPCGSSTGGSLTCVAEEIPLQAGTMAGLHIVNWESAKLKRKARSSNASETLALNNAEDSLFWGRMLWLSFQGVDVRGDREAIVSQVTGTLVLDNKTVYDGLLCEVAGLAVAEKRLALELRDIQERLLSSSVNLRWVHSEANLGDSLTKVNARLPLAKMMESFSWAVTQDGLQRSSKKRRQAGLDVLEDDGQVSPCIQGEEY
jgi:hypothetical protein